MENLQNRLDLSGAVCYTMDAVNESGCLKGTEMSRQPENTKITAAYERLSRDDERENESVSIEHQKAILEEYAKKNGFNNLIHFTEACGII